uniref:Uncharacterized protein n=1 Tax=Homalodisca liturata TaxID=320908 RepID=A0A1B6JLC1_9HEMI
MYIEVGVMLIDNNLGSVRIIYEMMLSMISKSERDFLMIGPSLLRNTIVGLDGTPIVLTPIEDETNLVHQSLSPRLSHRISTEGGPNLPTFLNLNILSLWKTLGYRNAVDVSQASCLGE